MNHEEEIEILRSSIESLDQAARQLGTIAPVLQAAYLTIITLSDLKRVVGNSLLWGVGFLLPVIFWILSLWLVARAFIPQDVNSDISEKAEYKTILRRKSRLIGWSQLSLIAGLFFMGVAVVVYFSLPTPPSQPTVVVTPTPFVVSTPFTPLTASLQPPTITPSVPGYSTPTSLPNSQTPGGITPTLMVTPALTVTFP